MLEQPFVGTGVPTVLNRLEIIANFIVVNFISYTEILFVQIFLFQDSRGRLSLQDLC